MLPPIKLPRLPVNWKEQPELFERYWDDAMSSIETTLNAILSIPAIETALVAVAAATAAAQAAANNANSAANATKSEASLVNSFPTNFIAPLIDADSTGNVTIALHDRQYGDMALNPTVSVDAGMVATGAAVGSVIWIYYIDALREGGAVAYLFTTVQPVQGGNIHSVGVVKIPAAGTQSGNGVNPPGWAPLT